MEKQNRLTVGIISLTTIVAIIIACWKLNQPGLYYDEALFVNAATGAHTNIFINYRFMGVPVFLMDYIGALKAWIYYPIFAIFGVNTWSVRLPAILIGTAGALMLTAALWRAFGPKAALAGAVLILLDPTMVIHSRLDWGPNALMFFFRGLLVLAVVNWSRTLSVRWAGVAVIAICLGLFDKLNFIWMACATMASVVLIYFDKLKKFTQLHKVQAWVLAGIAAGITGLAILKGIRVAEHFNIGWGDRMVYAFKVIRITIAGGGALNFIAGDGARVENPFWLGYASALLLGIWGIRKFIKEAEQKRLFIWMATLVILVMFAFLFTKSATGPHHASMLCGLWQILLAPLVAMAWDKLNPKITAGKILYAGSLTFVAAGSLTVIVTCIKAFSKPININWDPASWQAAQLAKKYQGANFICTDWGMGTLLVGLSRQHTNIYDNWPSFTKKEEAIDVIKSIDPQKDTYIYTTLPDFENFKGNRDNLFTALQAAGIKPSLYKSYSNWTGKPIIEVLHIPPSNATLPPK
jgi:4-amino-4-deoxy-L-arabinose transferase-like glycosyltransferase